MPCNREAAGSNLSGVFAFFLKGAHYEVDYSGKKNLLRWTAMHIDFVMCKKSHEINASLEKKTKFGYSVLRKSEEHLRQKLEKLTLPKSVKKWALGSLKFQFDEKYQKNEEGPLETMKKIAKKSHKAEITCTKKFWSNARLEPTSFCFAGLKNPD